MSVTAAATKAIGLPEIARHKGGTPLVCLTAYTTPIAELVDPCCDIVLVGDSLGMVLHGLESTLGVRSEEHTSELQSLMRISYAVFCLKQKTNKHKTNYT